MIIKLLHNMKTKDGNIFEKGMMFDSDVKPIHSDILMDVRDLPWRFEIIKLDKAELKEAPKSELSAIAQAEGSDVDGVAPDKEAPLTADEEEVDVPDEANPGAVKKTRQRQS